jgi:hypothetical protein
MKKNILLLLVVFAIVIVILVVLATNTNIEGLKQIDGEYDIPNNGAVPDGYYKIGNTNKMKKLPVGYVANKEKTDIIPLTNNNYWNLYSSDYKKTNFNQVNSGNKQNDFVTKYGSVKKDLYNIQYHDDASDIQKQNNMYDLSFSTFTFKNQTGNVVSIPYNVAQDFTTFYTPGTYTYGASSYVPTYTDSVLLSRTTILKNMDNTNQTKYKYKDESGANKPSLSYSNV